MKEAGKRSIKAFDVKSRFIHCTFIRLEKDGRKLGNKGNMIGLEINMRPTGGVTRDRLHHANSVDECKIWPDMVVYDSSQVDQKKSIFSVSMWEEEFIPIAMEKCYRNIGLI